MLVLFFLNKENDEENCKANAQYDNEETYPAAAFLSFGPKIQYFCEMM